MPAAARGPRRLLAALDAATRPGRAPPAGRWAQLGYGAAQPLLGMRAVLTRRALWRFVPAPMVGLVAACIAAAVGYRVLRPHGPAPFAQVLVAAFALLASGPVLILSNHYARLAAEARAALGLGEARPRLQPFHHVASDAIAQTAAQYALVGQYFLFGGPLLVGVTILGSPETQASAGLVVVALRPGLWALAMAWMVPWVVVEALESARVEGRPPVASGARPPLLARWLRWLGVGFLMARWSRRWWSELAFLEERPWLALGFLVSTAVLCCVPGLQFAFRPAVIVGASHLLGHLERAAQGDEPRTDAAADDAG